MGNPSPRYTSEFKAKAVELYHSAGPEIFECIECSCNRIRIHSAIGWMSPVDFEAKMAEETAEAA